MATVSRPADEPYSCPCGITLSRKRDRGSHEKTKNHIQFVTNHAHFWTIESANGPISRGRCKVCGKEQNFANSLMGQGDWFRSGEEDEQSADERASTFH